MLPALRKILGSLVCCLLMTLSMNVRGEVSVSVQQRKDAESINKLKNSLHYDLQDTTRIRVLGELSEQLRYKDPNLALQYVKERLQLNEKYKDLYEKARSLKELGLIYLTMSEYSKALHAQFEALRLFEKLEKLDKVDEQLYNTLNSIGVSYFYLRKYDLASHYLNEAIKLKEKNIDLKVNLGLAYNNLGLLQVTQKKFNEGISYYKKSIEENYKDGYEDAFPYNNLGVAYTHIGQPDKAEYYYKKALQFQQNDAYTLTHRYQALGELYIHTNRLNEALTYLFKAEETAKQSGVNVSLVDIYSTIISIYLKQGNYQQAYLYKDKFHALNDSVLNEKVTKQINEVRTQYELEKKDKNIQIAEARAGREQLLRNILILAFIPVVVIVIILYRNVRLKRKMNHILSERSEQLEIQKQHIEKMNHILGQYNKELTNENISARYEILKSKTNPHFLFNSLHTLSSIVRKDQKQAIEYIERFSALYRMILTTGNQTVVSLADELAVVNNYFYVQKIQFGGKLIVHFDIRTDPNKLFIPPFALQMVVENAIKHNVITRLRNLRIDICADDLLITITNNLQKKSTNTLSTTVGQKSIVDRYALLTHHKPVFIETKTEYVVRLPLLESNKLNSVMEKQKDTMVETVI